MEVPDNTIAATKLNSGRREIHEVGACAENSEWAAMGVSLQMSKHDATALLWRCRAGEESGAF
jgi:hypothetical protein